jgi:hypothetical protein
MAVLDGICGDCVEITRVNKKSDKKIVRKAAITAKSGFFEQIQKFNC